MPIEPVTMYRATCDVCKMDDGSDYWAWAGEDQARESWGEDDLVTEDGRVFCTGCIPDDVCRYSDDNAHEWVDGACDHCDADEPSP